MKAMFVKNCFIATIFLVIFLSSPAIVSGQENVKSAAKSSIPENVNAIFQNSCTPCHITGGGSRPLAVVNFSEWDNYSAEDKVKKAEQVCTVMQKGTMPPAMIKEKRPEAMPTKDQINAVCKWAKSLKRSLK
jgi:cytochrome c5